MDSLISQLPERQLINGIRQAEQIGAELKAAKRMSGASGQLNYTLQSANTWDRTETVSAGSITQMTLVVTMTCDQTQPWPEALLYMDMRANGTADANKFSYLNGTYAGTTYSGALGWSDGTSVITSGGMTRNFSNLSVIFTWTMDFFYKGTITYYAKPVIRSSCGGTMTLTRTL
ncbi:hypothetical protein AB0280_15535 [Pseudarthrobacter sp902506025]|uniref:hypothetical protein n=1 Tax=Pseudarthrobacter sp. 902506025 TaxID=3155291 RepID=UPI00345014C6